MKKIITNEELQNKLIEGIELLCGVVKTTLGPKGRNVIIDHSSFTPFITNDGVTIAQNIESDDAVINTILELTKEACIKTNEIVGDGTTTTLVLLESIFLEGIKFVKKGYSPIGLKNEINTELENIINKVRKESKIPNIEELKKIACISANDDEIGNLLIEAYKKVGIKNIKIKEHDCEETKVDYLKGYYFDTIIASSYFFKNENKIELDNAKILLYAKAITELEEINLVINYAYKTNESIVVIAKDYSEIIINEILNHNYENNLNIILLKNPGYGEEEQNILSDIAVISNTDIVYESDFNLNMLGSLENIEITNEKTKLTFKSNNNIETRIAELENKINYKDDIFKDSYQKRIAMLKNGTANILVGATTITERREKKMRYDDALCALKCADKGILPGSGLILYKISFQFHFGI